MRQQVRRSSLIVSVFRSYRRKPRTPSLPGFIRQREQQRYRSQLQVCPFLRGHGRHDARSEHQHPRRNRYAPLSKTNRRRGAGSRGHYGVGGGSGQAVDLVGSGNVVELDAWNLEAPVNVADASERRSRWNVEVPLVGIRDGAPWNAACSRTRHAHCGFLFVLVCMW
jgi:hypothetical protein